MATGGDGDLNHVQTLKAAVHFTVGRICEKLGAEEDLVFSRHTIATLSEFTCNQLETYSKDLEAFSNHAHRRIINPDDVKLLVRRNAQLAAHVRQEADILEQAAGKQRKKPGRIPKEKKTSSE